MGYSGGGDFSPLKQTYFYYGKGCQSYAFISEDRSYMLKFFKQKHLKPPFWCHYLPFTEEIIKRKDRFKDNLFKGCKVAYDLCKEECGLIAMHLNGDDIPIQSVDVVDKLGKKHTINPADFSFYIQLCGQPFLPTFKQLGLEEGKQLIDEVIALIEKRSLKGVRDKDPALIQNIALVDGHPIFIDLGQFVFDESIKEPCKREEDITSKVSPLLNIMEKNHKEKFTHPLRSSLLKPL